MDGGIAVFRAFPATSCAQEMETDRRIEVHREGTVCVTAISGDRGIQSQCLVRSNTADAGKEAMARFPVRV
jgi:hypothetical protein